MIAQLLRDSIDYPHLFMWRGALDPVRLKTWVSSSAFLIPLELLQLWSNTGGGDMFETEVLLCPLASDPEIDIEVANDFYWRAGLSKALFIFHVGTWLSVLSNKTGSIAFLEPESLAQTRSFQDINAWYIHGIRKEYAARYGLTQG